MATEMVESKSFEDKMKDLLKERIGDLLTDEDLKKLVERTFQSVFFTTRRNNFGQDMPSLAEEMTRFALTSEASKQISEWFNNNKEQIPALVQSVVEKGIVQIIAQQMSLMFSSNMHTFGQDLIRTMQNMRY